MLLLHFRHPETGQFERLDLRQPQAVLQAQQLGEVLPALRQLQDWQARGYGAAGYLAYEAAAAWLPTWQTTSQPTLQSQPACPDKQAGTDLPLLYFEIFAPEALQAEDAAAPMQAADTPAADWALEPWQPAQEEEAFAAAITQIKEAIAAGESYQVNYTLPFTSRFAGSSAALFAAMRSAQQAAYAAHIQLPSGAEILSASPELFFHWAGAPDAASGGRIITQPMKGTRPRGLWSEQDQALAQALRHSAKDRAENVMIVDLLRNDLGRIAQTGSVRAEELFAIEAYPSVWQMTSRISALTRPEVGLPELLQALFPCGSITGAPKLRTMDIIRRLELAARGVYCGAIGLLRPDGSATFSVAIRTLVLGAEPGSAAAQSPTPTAQRPARYHAGAGITWGSHAAEEWQEVQAKTRVVQADFLQQRAAPPFALIETLLWTGQEFAWLAGHEARLAASAAYYAYPFATAAWQAALGQAVQGQNTPQRVRSLLHADGRIEVSSSALAADFAPQWQRPGTGSQQGVQSFRLAAQATLRTTPSLYHKTTDRRVYAAALAGKPDDVWDVLLHNEDGQLCEFSIGNLVLRLDGVDYTPPIRCGLLPGVLRAQLLAQGVLQERVLYPADLPRAQGIWLINSVRGWVPMQISNA